MVDFSLLQQQVLQRGVCHTFTSEMLELYLMHNMFLLLFLLEVPKDILR